jgi:hypothetical protein
MQNLQKTVVSAPKQLGLGKRYQLLVANEPKRVLEFFVRMM